MGDILYGKPVLCKISLYDWILLYFSLNIWSVFVRKSSKYDDGWKLLRTDVNKLVKIDEVVNVGNGGIDNKNSPLITKRTKQPKGGSSMLGCLLVRSSSSSAKKSEKMKWKAGKSVNVCEWRICPQKK